MRASYVSHYTTSDYMLAVNVNLLCSYILAYPLVLPVFFIYNPSCFVTDLNFGAWLATNIGQRNK
jgi:hypothetical protein